MEIAVSIIVPVYNVKDYVRQCLDSILNQTFRSFELIIVDDGSTDGSGQICEEYAGRDSRITVIHQLNQGQSTARNTGIDRARGIYLSFIDSDDYIEPAMIETLHRNIVTEKADIAVCGIKRIKSRSTKLPSDPAYFQVMSGRDFFKETLIGSRVSVTPCDKLYRRNLFADLRYPAGRRTEDGYIAVDLFPKAGRVVVDMTPLYCYRLREGSASKSRFSPADYDTIEAYERCLAIVKEKYPECYQAAQMRYIWSNFETYDKMTIAHHPDAGILRKRLLRMGRSILRNPYVHRPRKAALFVLAVSSRLYRRCCILYINKVDERDVS